ncbi:DUF397 domain-containing protein [Streptomyces sp. ISL-100]|uniref:DUF397 domain-containing protein n=1 Tax=Streptomyces sp. ISL-100 TaxID=2819173 RepID=UPI001BE7D7AD|nr:DUF397 domain-containing protein [Streptomyces sp. ISL-100]MBT2394414.1 DUF397 domain-containing protein [Streptomyces sp. ISL-100]
MPTHDWQKSSYCAQGDSCVHVTRGNGAVRLMESSDATGAILHTSRATWAVFLRDLKEERRG